MEPFSKYNIKDSKRNNHNLELESKSLKNKVSLPDAIIHLEENVSTAFQLDNKRKNKKESKKNQEINAFMAQLENA